jgi:PAS domain S-box-containing protein
VVGVVTVLLAAVFAVDLVTPLGFAHGTLYVPVVLLGILSGRTAPAWISAVAGVVLTLVGIFVSPTAPAGLPMELVVANRAGSIIALLVTLAVGVLLLRARRKLTATNVDLRAAQDAINENLRLLEMAADVGRLGAWRVRLDDRRVTWSDDTYRIFGLRIGSRAIIEQVERAVSEEDRKRVAESLERCARDGVPFDLELEITRPTGERVWVRSIGRTCRDERGQVVAIEGAVQDVTRLKRIELEYRRLTERLTATLESLADPFFILDGQWRFVYVNSHTERLAGPSSDTLIGRDFWEVTPVTRESEFGRQYLEAARTRTRRHFRAHSAAVDRWLDVSVYPIPDGGLAIHVRDLTEQRLLETQLQQAQRLDSIGQLTGGVAHDFNNLLTIILGNADLLLDQLGDGNPLRPMADMIANAAESGAQLTQGLLAFARRQVLEPRPVDVNQQVAAMDGLLRRTLGGHVELECVRGAGLWPALVDPAQLENALLNLCLNARDAMPDGGRLTIETANVRVGDEYVSQHPEAEPGQGTTFKVYLPRASTPVEALQPRSATGVPGGSERILLVEDDEMVRRFAADQLRHLGYQVAEAASGPEALERIDAGLDVDLLFTSGYTENAIVHHGRLDPGVQLLAKPYRRDELARRVRTVLDEPERRGS